MNEQEVLNERTSWKMFAGMALASIVLAAGSVWFLTQDFDTSSLTIQTANEPEPTTEPRPTSTPAPSAPEPSAPEPSAPEPSAGTPTDEQASDNESDEAEDPCSGTQVSGDCVDVGDLFSGIELPTPSPTLIPVLPQLVPRPLVTTIPTRPTPRPQADAPAAAPAPAPPPPPVYAPAPAPAPPPIVYVQPAPAPPPPPVVYVQPAPAPPPAPVNPAACTQIVVSFDLNFDGVADGTLPSPCSPCPSGAAPGLLNADSMLDC